MPKPTPNSCKGFLSNTLDDSNWRTNGETECNVVSGKRLRSYIFGFAFRYLRPASGEGLPLCEYPLKIHTFPSNQKPRISHPNLFLGIYESYSVGLQCTHGLNGQASALSNNAKINALCL